MSILSVKNKTRKNERNFSLSNTLYTPKYFFIDPSCIPPWNKYYIEMVHVIKQHPRNNPLLNPLLHMLLLDHDIMCLF